MNPNAIPQSFQTANRSGEFGRGLLRLYRGGHQLRDAALTKAAWSLGTLAPNATPLGVGTRINAGSTATSGESLSSQISSGMTLLFVASKFGQIGGAGSDFLIGEHATSAGDYNWGLYENLSAGNLFFFVKNASGSATNSGAGTAWTAGAGPQVWTGTYGDGDNNIRLYLNGVQVASSAQTGNIQANNLTLRSCFWQGGTPNFVLLEAGIWNRCMPADEVARLYLRLNKLYRTPRPRTVVFGADLGVGGTTYNDTVTESVALTDSNSVALTAAATMSESVSLSDSPSVVLTAAATVAESVSLADASTPAVTVVVTLAESVTLTDTIAAGNIFSDTLTESLSTSDAVSVTAEAAPSVTESLALSDAMSPSLIVSATVTEDLSLSDSTTGSVAGSGGGFTDADVDLVWDELMDGTHSARVIMGAMAQFLEQRGLLP